METKIINVFYGDDYLPYKDKDRIVHYPIVGGAFLGASDTTRIKFYIGEIGGVNTTWLSIGKLANGKTVEKILLTSSDENGNYAYLDLSSAFTQAKGDLYITLAGVEGTATMEYDEDTGLYTLDGNPVVGMTGPIKLSINYATPIIDYSIDENTLQDLLPLISQKLNTSKGIYVLNSDIIDEGEQNEGQLFYRKDIKALCEWSSGNLVELYKIAQVYDGNNFDSNNYTISEFYTLTSGAPVLISDDEGVFGLINVGHGDNSYIITRVQLGANTKYGYKDDLDGTENLKTTILGLTYKTFAFKEDFATINGEVITNGGNIEIQGGSGNPESFIDGSFVVDGDNAQLQFAQDNGNTKVVPITLADSDKAGLMSPSDVEAINNLNQDVATLKQQTIRLLYSESENPTATDILNFVIANGYDDPTKYTSIAVIVEGTNHVWKWVNDASIDGTWVFNDELTETYENRGGFELPFESNSITYTKISINWNLSPTYGMAYDATLVYEKGVGWSSDNYKTIVISTETEIPSDALTWLLENTTTPGTYSYGYFEDFGLDTVGKFTNSTMGAIKGSTSKGKVYAETDGTGSLVGYDDLVNGFSPLYDNTATYDVGDLVEYNGILYKCTTAITTAEDWTSAHWTATNIDSELSAVKASVPTISANPTISGNTARLDGLNINGINYNAKVVGGWGDSKVAITAPMSTTGISTANTNWFNIGINLSGTHQNPSGCMISAKNRDDGSTRVVIGSYLNFTSPFIFYDSADKIGAEFMMYPKKDTNGNDINTTDTYTLKIIGGKVVAIKDV